LGPSLECYWPRFNVASIAVGNWQFIIVIIIFCPSSFSVGHICVISSILVTCNEFSLFDHVENISFEANGLFVTPNSIIYISNVLSDLTFHVVAILLTDSMSISFMSLEFSNNPSLNIIV
jgi:hypothetical protein